MIGYVDKAKDSSVPTEANESQPRGKDGGDCAVVVPALDPRVIKKKNKMAHEGVHTAYWRQEALVKRRKSGPP